MMLLLMLLMTEMILLSCLIGIVRQRRRHGRGRWTCTMTVTGRSSLGIWCRQAMLLLEMRVVNVIVVMLLRQVMMLTVRRSSDGRHGGVRVVIMLRMSIDDLRRRGRMVMSISWLLVVIQRLLVVLRRLSCWE